MVQNANKSPQEISCLMCLLLFPSYKPARNIYEGRYESGSYIIYCQSGLSVLLPLVHWVRDTQKTGAETTFIEIIKKISSASEVPYIFPFVG